MDISCWVFGKASLSGAEPTDVAFTHADLIGVNNLSAGRLCRTGTLYEAVLDSTRRAEKALRCPELVDRLE